MQGIFIMGRRPKSKKEIKEFVEGVNLFEEHGNDPTVKDLIPETRDPYGLVIEATSIFGNEFDGSLAEAKRTSQCGPFYFVGPDPYRERKFYGTIEWDRKNNKWKVK